MRPTMIDDWNDWKNPTLGKLLAKLFKQSALNLLPPELVLYTSKYLPSDGRHAWSLICRKYYEWMEGTTRTDKVAPCSKVLIHNYLVDFVDPESEDPRRQKLKKRCIICHYRFSHDRFGSSQSSAVVQTCDQNGKLMDVVPMPEYVCDEHVCHLVRIAKLDRGAYSHVKRGWYSAMGGLCRHCGMTATTKKCACECDSCTAPVPARLYLQVLDKSNDNHKEDNSSSSSSSEDSVEKLNLNHNFRFFLKDPKSATLEDNLAVRMNSLFLGEKQRDEEIWFVDELPDVPMAPQKRVPRSSDPPSGPQTGVAPSSNVYSEPPIDVNRAWSEIMGTRDE